MPVRVNNTKHDTIVLASNNTGKLKELNSLFENNGIHIVLQNNFNVSDADETGLSFIENAIIKARHACHHTGLPAIADDSGLSVDALQGAPGIYSARFSGEHGNDTANNQKLLDALQGVATEERTGRFICALAFMEHENDPTPVVCQASWEGRILKKEIGSHGFGYDPLFWVAEKQCSSAELPPEIKNQISHRAKALQLLVNALRDGGHLSS